MAILDRFCVHTTSYKRVSHINSSERSPTRIDDDDWFSASIEVVVVALSSASSSFYGNIIGTVARKERSYAVLLLDV